MEHTTINTIVAIHYTLDVDNRETVRQRLEDRAESRVREDPRYKEVREAIKVRGYAEDYSTHAMTFHFVVNEDGKVTINEAPNGQFLDPALNEEGYMGEKEYQTHVQNLRDLAKEVADEFDGEENLLA